MRSCRRPVTALVGAVLGIALLGGCSAIADASGAAAARDQARARVLELATGVAISTQGIDDYARSAAERIGADGPTSLIGLEQFPNAPYGEPFGRLTFLVEHTPVQGWGAGDDYGPFCFWVDFSSFGYVGDADGDGVHGLDCPADAAPIAVPVDTTVREVVAVNASEAARQVLAELGPDGTTAVEVESAIAALLVAPDGEFSVPAVPHALVQGTSIGVSMGQADDCVMVSWIDGVAADVSVPRVLLQPGELGCQPSTAIADPEQFRSPH